MGCPIPSGWRRTSLRRLFSAGDNQLYVVRFKAEGLSVADPESGRWKVENNNDDADHHQCDDARVKFHGHILMR